MNKVLPKKQCASEKNVPFHEILQSLTEHFSWRPFVKSSSILITRKKTICSLLNSGNLPSVSPCSHRFFRFPWNNIVHHRWRDTVESISWPVIGPLVPILDSDWLNPTQCTSLVKGCVVTSDYSLLLDLVTGKYSEASLFMLLMGILVIIVSAIGRVLVLHRIPLK